MEVIRPLVVSLFVILLIVIVVLAQFEDDQLDFDEAWFTDDMYNSSYFSNITEIKYGIIAPGTKWCGQGSKAEDYSSLGKFIKTDLCCRAHDNCDIVIEAGATFYNITNPDKSSRLSCECDKEFYSCLKKIQNVVSKTIGTIYFDILQKKCLYTKDENFEWRDNEPYSNSKFIKFIRKLFS